ncbi:MAG: esterase-like activity of phytase family protein, partial [Pseudomonadota bacterium]|nr:esterase-like activity of phytase family protein [Pseudomonadota bacterium]
MFPRYDKDNPTRDQVETEIAAHGASTVEIKVQRDGSWEFVRSTRHKLTATALTTVLLNVGPNMPVSAAEQLVGRAVLPAATFSRGPTSGQYLGPEPINGQTVPFEHKQPVQGFSAVLSNGDSTFMVMSDNGFGSLENSADYQLRVYRIRPHFKTKEGGSGGIAVLGHIELHDPDEKIPFAITNHFTKQRLLTGADFDIESMQRAPDGTLWFGDEFGPFLLHTDAKGKVLEAPIPLPDLANPGKEIRSPQNPFNEEASALRVMNAVRTHAQGNHNHKTPVFSPWHVMIDDGNPAIKTGDREEPPVGSGLAQASSEIFNVKSIQQAGYPVVTWTVNDKARMLELMGLGVNGIISDRPDLLLQAVQEFDANQDGTPGDFMGADGLIDLTKFDAQGHRGARDLRPENTLPAMEVALDHLVTTLETDTGITRDGIPVLDHGPHVEAAKCRRIDGAPYELANQRLVKDLTLSELQSAFICDKIIRDPAFQKHDLALSPASVAFAALHGLIHPYVMPTVQQLFDFVKFYQEYYKNGAGNRHPHAALRAQNAAKVRFNIETKINPRAELVTRTVGPLKFASALANMIVANKLEERADIQSFDFRTLLVVQKKYPAIRTVYLFGDFPIYPNDPTNPNSDNGTNLQDENGTNTPWLAGLFWPYRVTQI